MFCVICGTACENKTCSGKCRVALHRLQTKKSDGIGFVYTIHFDGILKFGASRDPFIRVRQVELASGRVGGVLQVYGPYHDHMKVESMVHKAIADNRVCGEWYRLQANDAIKSMMANLEPIDSIPDAQEVCDINDAVDHAKKLVAHAVHSKLSSDIGGIVFQDRNVLDNAVASSMNAVTLASKSRCVNAVHHALTMITAADSNLVLGLSKAKLEDIQEVLKVAIAYAALINNDTPREVLQQYTDVHLQDELVKLANCIRKSVLKGAA